jgi:short-subunit dehydrogenase
MKIAIVTGASSGMGREFVLQLGNYVSVEEIWVIARRRDALEALAEKVSTKIRPVTLDLCKEESFTALAELLAAEKPDVKLLVNAAGFGKFGSHHRISMEDELKMIDLNSRALVAVTRLVLPYSAQTLLVKFAPHRFLMDLWQAQQKKPRITTS